MQTVIADLRRVFTRTRWRIFSFMFGFGLLAYLQQKSLTVAAAQMMPQLGLTQMQIGWLQQSFVIGYAVLQLPGGLFGQRYGARLTFVVISLAAFLALVATPIAPYLVGAGSLFPVLLGAQLLLGLSQAPIFPVSAGVFEAWFPPSRWSFVEGMQTMGMGLGAALCPPLIASLMTLFGWQLALLWSALPALLLIAGWAWYGRNDPRDHPSVTREELAEIGGSGAKKVDSDISLRRLWGLLRNRNVLFITLSYVLMNYAFYMLSNWCFLYLVQERGFSVLESGWLAMTPALASAIGAGIGGVLAGRLCARFGNRLGFRLVPLTALPAAGLLLLLVVNVGNPYWAVAVLALSFGCVELAEGSFWGGAMSIGRGDTMAVCGVMNTGGNVGGIITLPIVAYLSGHGSWHAAFLIGAASAIASAAAWLAIDADRVVGGATEAASAAA